MGTQGKTNATVRTAIVVALAFTLTGCATAAGEPPETDQPMAVETLPATPTPSAAPTVLPTVEAVTPTTCDNALTLEAYADFADSGLHLDHYTWWRTDIQFMEDDGGVACIWKGTGDGLVVFGQLALTPAEWQVRKAEFVESGYIEESTPVGGYVNEPDTDPNYTEGDFIYRGGLLFYVSYPDLTQWVPALSVS